MFVPNKFEPVTVPDATIDAGVIAPSDNVTAPVGVETPIPLFPRRLTTPVFEITLLEILIPVPPVYDPGPEN